MFKNYSIGQKTIEEHYCRMQSIHDKVESGVALTTQERFFFCQGQKFEYLFEHAMCLEEFYGRVYAVRNFGLTDKFAPVQERHHLFYESLVREWEKEINKGNHPDELMQAIAKEGRAEFRLLRREFSRINSPITSLEYLERKFRISEISKYRYIVIKGILELIIQKGHYQLFLRGKRIIFDQYSLTHILTWHFGYFLKPYENEKSHFSETFHYEEIHLMLEKIFKIIDDSGKYKRGAVQEIIFKYKDQLYKIYCSIVQRGSKKFLRLKTFFPIEEEKMLRDVRENYIEEIIDRDHSIYVRSNLKPSKKK